MRRPSRIPLASLLGLALLALPAAAMAAGGPPGEGSANAVAGARFLIIIALALVGAKVGGLLARHLGQPAVVGEILAGVLVGPFVLGRASGLHVDATAPELVLLAEVGIVLLLFEIGLETQLGQMLKVGLSSILVAVIGIVVPFGLGLLSVWGLSEFGWIEVHPDLRLLLGIFLGATLTATSVGVTAHVLRDMGKMASPESRILVGAAVLDDVLGLVILSVVTGVGAAAAAGLSLADAVGPGPVAMKLGLALAFLVGSVALGRALAPRIFDVVAMLETRGLLATATFSFVLALAYVAHMAGSAVIIGGFAAGLVLSRTRQVADIEHEMRPVTDIFAPLFFVAVGASVDVSRLNPFNAENWSTLLLVGVLVVVAVVGKMAAGLGVVGGGVSRLVVGVGMVPRGEVGLIFAQAGALVSCRVGDKVEMLLSPSLHAAITLTVLLTTIIGPFALRLAFKRQEAS